MKWNESKRNETIEWHQSCQRRRTVDVDEDGIQAIEVFVSVFGHAKDVWTKEIDATHKKSIRATERARESVRKRKRGDKRIND